MIIIAIHVLICIINWYIFHKNYSVGGKWYNETPTLFDMFFAFFPVINVFPLIFETVERIPEINLSKFFNVKK